MQVNRRETRHNGVVDSNLLNLFYLQTCLKSVACHGNTCCGATKSCGKARRTTCCPGTGICQYFPLKKSTGCCNPARKCGGVSAARGQMLATT